MVYYKMYECDDDNDDDDDDDGTHTEFNIKTELC